MSLKRLIKGALGVAVLVVTLASSAHATISVTCSGSAAANTTTINNAITTAGGSGGDVVQLPTGTCNVTGPITLNQSYVSLVGVAPGASVLNCTGSNDCIRIGDFDSVTSCTGSTRPTGTGGCPQTYDNAVSNLTVRGVSGALFNISDAAQVTISNIDGSGWDDLYTQDVNTVTVRDVHLYATDTSSSGNAVSLYNAITGGTSSGWYRSDAVTFNDVTINPSSRIRLWIRSFLAGEAVLSI